MTSVSAQADAGVAEGVLRAIESTLPGIQTSDTMQDQITRLIMLLDHLVRCRVYMWHVLNLLFSNKFILRDPNCTFWCDKTLGSTYTTTSLETWIWNMFSIPTTLVFFYFFLTKPFVAGLDSTIWCTWHRWELQDWNTKGCCSRDLVYTIRCGITENGSFLDHTFAILNHQNNFQNKC